MQFEIPAEHLQGDFDYTPRPRGQTIITFKWHPELQGKKSEEKGRPVYENKIYIEKLTPGSTDTVLRPIRPEDKRDFAREWEAFQRGEEAPPEGTPIELWPAVDPATIHNLKAVNVRTVEQLAALPDEKLGIIGMSARTIREKAKAYVEVNKDVAAAQKFAAQNAELQERIAFLESKLGEVLHVQNGGKKETKEGKK